MNSGCITVNFETHTGNENNIEIKFATPIIPKQTIENNITETILPTSTTAASSPTPKPPIFQFSPTPALGVGSTIIGKDGMPLVYVPTGGFIMGSDDKDISGIADHPAHTVYLDAFWIDRTEVTNKMFRLCVNAGVCRVPWITSSSTQPTYYSNSKFDNFPAMDIPWWSANTYCTWADRRLPTEAEWEKAARGTDGRVFPWGMDVPTGSDLGNFNNIARDTTEVGKYPKGVSPYGTLDMAGNVWEWVSDLYNDIFYSISPVSNPLGPDQGHFHVIRGGSWDMSYIRSWSRSLGYDVFTGVTPIGFRCALSASP